MKECPYVHCSLYADVLVRAGGCGWSRPHNLPRPHVLPIGETLYGRLYCRHNVVTSLFLSHGTQHSTVDSFRNHLIHKNRLR